MTPFLILFFYLCIVVPLFLSRCNQNKKRLYQAILGGFGLWLLLALRSWTCGLDLLYEDRGVGYVVSFIDIANCSFFQLNEILLSYEIGFKILCWLISRISTNPQVFLAIVGALNIGLIGYTLYKKSPNIILSYVVFACLGLYIFSFSGLRQGLAISITFFAFNFIEDKKIFKFLVLILLASTIHKSSIAFLPAYFIRNVPLPLSRALVSVICMFPLIPLLMLLVQYVSVLIYGHEKYVSDSGGAYGLLFLFIIIFFYSYVREPLSYTDKKKINQIRLLTLVAIYLQSLGVVSAGSMVRVGYSYTIFFCLLIPMTTNLLENHERVRMNVIISLLLIAFFVYTNSHYSLGVIPYRFFWEEFFII